MIITTEQLVDFFLARAAGAADTVLFARQIPIATNSFAPVPCRVLAGELLFVRRVKDIDWHDNWYDVLELPEDSTGCVVERESVSNTWRFTGLGGDQWFVSGPEEWRIKNAFEGNCEGICNSAYGPFTPERSSA